MPAGMLIFELINPFHANDLFLYSLLPLFLDLENQKFSGSI